MPSSPVCNSPRKAAADFAARAPNRPRRIESLFDRGVSGAGVAQQILVDDFHALAVGLDFHGLDGNVLAVALVCFFEHVLPLRLDLDRGDAGVALYGASVPS